MTCMVPLRLEVERTGKVLWENKKPSSTLYCRPIRFKYAKENRETILEEERFIKESELRPTILPGGFLCVHRKEIMMINGKVHTVLLGLSDSALICVVTGLQR